jgi:protein dithiol oxidoreductase (disulfide-forming)
VLDRLVRSTLASLIAILALGWVSTSVAQERASRSGFEFQMIPQQPIATGARIEVVELFWYGCPFCYQLQGPLEAWLKRKPEDVELRRIPAIFRESWVPHARLFYTLETIGELDRLHQAVYRSIHSDREDLTSAESTAAFAMRHGIDRARWLAAYQAPETDRKVEQSRLATRSYAIRGTPSLVVDGLYVTSTGMTESVPGVIQILEDLIGLARQRRTGK